MSTAPEGVKLTMRYLCRPRARRVSTSTMWEAILAAFEHLPGVDFAYPTQRRFDQALEGKPALRGGTPQVPRAPQDDESAAVGPVGVTTLD